MAKKVLPDLAVVLLSLREGQGWSQGRLGEAAGFPEKVIADYERGRRTLTRERLELLISWMGVPPEFVDELLDLLARSRAASRSPVGPSEPFSQTRQVIEGVSARFGRLAAGFARSALTMLTFEGEALRGRQRAEMLWGRLKKRTPPERRVLVEDVRDFRHWVLCERTAAESIELAANHPREALELAELSLRIAERVPGEERWRRRLEGYALFHVANGHRVCQQALERDAALARARKLWEEGDGGDPGWLNEAVPLWIEAAVRRDQRRFPDALKRIDEALALERGELRGKMLLTKSAILKTIGDLETLTVVLREAASLVDARLEPRLALVIRFNLLSALCDLDRAAEAMPQLGELRKLAERIGEELDLARVVWLEGQAAAGLGFNKEAETALEQARRAFRGKDLAFDYALVSLDLSLLLLELGRTERVQVIATEMLWLFKAQGVHQEALAALHLFCESARKEVATVELTRRVVRFLRRAQLDLALRFEPEEGADIR